jgi:hypothetical protein
MKRLGLLLAFLGFALIAASSVGAGMASADRGMCEEEELAARYATESAPFANWSAERKAAYITEAGVACWAEVKVEEEDAARQQAQLEQIEKREAERKAEREAERKAERELQHREEAARIHRERHHVCMEAPGVEGCAVRPHSMIYGAHASIYGIHWLNWGPQRAVGVGHILWRRTVSEPHFGPYRAKLVLTEPGECGRGTWYSRRTLTIKRAEVLERNQLFGPCDPYY